LVKYSCSCGLESAGSSEDFAWIEIRSKHEKVFTFGFVGITKENAASVEKYILH
jgi:hypothetical protein